MEKIGLATSLPTLQAKPSGKAGGLAADFAKTLGEVLQQVDNAQKQADQASARLQAGDNVSIPDVMLSLEKADITMRLAVQMRNKVVEAYQEIMRMQV
ncbi:MAG: flagellar hook-basal body complex protein FliE [Deltaproteobacteria bacterium]|nr:MAG: flagellar hook-basal body complex protein FliE [Deltaproteobacteria bacterium]